MSESTYIIMTGVASIIIPVLAVIVVCCKKVKTCKSCLCTCEQQVSHTSADVSPIDIINAVTTPGLALNTSKSQNPIQLPIELQNRRQSIPPSIQTSHPATHILIPAVQSAPTPSSTPLTSINENPADSPPV